MPELIHPLGTEELQCINTQEDLQEEAWDWQSQVNLKQRETPF